MQLIGNPFDETTLIRAASPYECATEKQYEEVVLDINTAAKEAE